MAAGRVLLAGCFAVALAVGFAPLPSDAATSTVTISNDSFSPLSFNPNPITINQGDSVIWMNNGPSAHTTTSDGGIWDSGTLLPGHSFTQVFPTAGTFTYHCNIHPTMTGSVIVVGAGGTTTTTTTTTTASSSNAVAGVPGSGVSVPSTGAAASGAGAALPAVPRLTG